MSFSQALSGLNAQQEKLGAIGNNIANSQTVGFKSSNVQFADVFAESKIGLGTKVSTVLQNFGQGNVESSSRNMDLAISGEGFFRFQQPGGEVGYSRNGQLTLTADGDLVNAQGARIMGYGADAEGNVQAGGNVEALSIDAGDMEAKATTSLGINLNLNSGEKGLDPDNFDSSDSETYSFSTNAQVYDSQGNARNLSLYFIKDGGESNKWSIQGKLTGGPEDGQEYSRKMGNLKFNQDGTLKEDNSIPLSLTGGEFGAGNPFEALNVEFNFNSESSQFAKESTVGEITQTGYTAGSLVGTTIEDDGTIMRNYSNEESRAAGQIVLADFRNPEGLKPEGDNLWSATGASGQELVGTPGSGQRGLVEPGAIETSNVDMGEELVDMIVSQRAYQANSQTITTQDELLQTIINM